MEKLSCPGWYCGRTLLENGSVGDCGPCPRGFRRNDSFICEPCLETPSFYDWLFLGFMVMIVLILHWFFIDMVSMRRRKVYKQLLKIEYTSCSNRQILTNPSQTSFSKNVLVHHISAVFEVALSSLLALLLTQPLGTLQVHSCPITTMSDWYTLFYNPTPNYEEKVYCSQEAVYPMYTMVFLFHVLSLVLMLLIRPWICQKFLPRQGKMAVYAAMYFLPILLLTHATIGGLIYYAFPYLIVVVSVISSAAHFSVKMDQSVASLIRTTVMQPRNIVILLGHWSLHAYGFISITQLRDPLVHGLLILLVPVPAIFYILTARFTDPAKFYSL